MSAGFPDDVQVAIVTHNNLATLPETLESLAAIGCPAPRMTVVDIACTDGTGAWLATYWPDVQVRRLEKNAGPNPGRNLGITGATSRFVLLMDADVLIDPGTVQDLRAEMVADDRIGIGSPIVVHLDRPNIIQYAGVGIHYICEATNPWLNRTREERGPASADIGAAAASALLIDRQKAIDIGLFDERYFMGKDDGDFTHRMRIGGYLIRELATATVRHRSRPRSTWLFYYQIRNRWHFMLKNYEARTLMLMLPVLIVHEPLQFALLAAKGHAVTYFKAIGGLCRMLPALGADRRFVAGIRRNGDGVLLQSGPLILRDDFATGGLFRSAKAAYDGFLNGYWRLLRRTFLHA